MHRHAQVHLITTIRAKIHVKVAFVNRIALRHRTKRLITQARRQHHALITAFLCHGLIICRGCMDWHWLSHQGMQEQIEHSAFLLSL